MSTLGAFPALHRAWAAGAVGGARLLLAAALALGGSQAVAQTPVENPTLVIELGSHSAPVRGFDVSPRAAWPSPRPTTAPPASGT